jgi:hypothetical protein
LKLEQVAKQQQDKMTREVRTCAEKQAKDNAYKDAKSVKEANAQLQGEAYASKLFAPPSTALESKETVVIDDEKETEAPEPSGRPRRAEKLPNHLDGHEIVIE